MKIVLKSLDYIEPLLFLFNIINYLKNVRGQLSALFIHQSASSHRWVRAKIKGDTLYINRMSLDNWKFNDTSSFAQYL